MVRPNASNQLHTAHLKVRHVYWAGSAAGSRPRRAPCWRPCPSGLMGASGGVFSPSSDASHLHPAPLQQHQAAQGRHGHHSSSAAGVVLFARADSLLLGSDLPRGSLGAAPALGCLGPRPLESYAPPPTHSRSGITRRPLAGGLTGWPAYSQGLCSYASRACSGSAAPAGVSTRRERLTAMPGQQAGKAPSN